MGGSGPRRGTQSNSGISANLIFGVLATAWTAIIGIVSVGWLVKLLGIESYALVGFFAMMQAAMSTVELGIGSTINREVSRGAALGDLARVGLVVHSLQALYIAASLLIGILIYVAAPYIAAHWLGASSLDQQEVVWSIRLMGVIAALRWPIGLYQGTLVGLQRALVSYRITAVMATVSNVGAIVLLVTVHQSLWVYFVWQLIAAVGTLSWMRWAAWRELGTPTEKKIDPRLLPAVLKQSIAISGVTVAGLLWSQLDKLVVSGSVDLADFGRYSLAALIASALVIILIPTFNVIYPRMSGLVAAGRTADLVNFYRTGTKVLLCGLIPISASAFFYAYDLLYVWTGNQLLAESTAPIVGMLIVGAASNGIMNFPYALQLATGNERFAMYINIAIIATAPIMVFLASRYGLWGGAIGWMMQASLYFIANVTLTHRFILKGLAGRWLLGDLAPGIAAGVLLTAGGHAVVSAITDSSIVRLGLAGLVALGTMVLIALARRETRHLIVQFYNSRAVA